MTGCGARSTSLWVLRNLFWRLSRDRNLPGLSMLHATTASLKPSVRASCRVDDALVSRENAGWTPKSGHPYPRQNCSQWPPAEKTGRGSLLNNSLCLSDDQIGQGTELNWQGFVAPTDGTHRQFHALFGPKTLDCHIHAWSLAELMGWIFQSIL